MSWPPELRALSAEEQELLALLLAPEFPGVAELRAQLPALRVCQVIRRRRGSLELRFAVVDAGAPKADVYDECPVETAVRDALPPRKVLLYVEEGLLDRLEVSDAGGEAVDELPRPEALDEPWCHAPPRPLSRELCDALSDALTAAAPPKLALSISPAEDGFEVELRRGWGSFERWSETSDDICHSVRSLLADVQERIARETGRAWPSPQPLEPPRRPSAMPRAWSKDDLRRRVLEHELWRRSMPRPFARRQGDTIHAGYGDPGQPLLELPPLPDG